MINTVYTEHDCVIKNSDIEELLDACSMAGLNLEETDKDKLCAELENSRSKDEPVHIDLLNLIAGWDEPRREYYVVIKNVYNPQNIIDILYERLVWERPDNPEDEIENINTNIERYLGVIEMREKISLAETKEKIKTLTGEMRKTLAVLEGDDYSEEEIERISDSLDTAYFDPITELLEGILVTIAGR